MSVIIKTFLFEMIIKMLYLLSYLVEDSLITLATFMRLIFHQTDPTAQRNF